MHTCMQLYICVCVRVSLCVFVLYHLYLPSVPHPICITCSYTVLISLILSVVQLFHLFRVYTSSTCQYSASSSQSRVSIMYVCSSMLQLVGSIKLQVSFAKETYKRDAILQKRPITLSILLTVATPYTLLFPSSLPYIHSSL